MILQDMWKQKMESQNEFSLLLIQLYLPNLRTPKQRKSGTKFLSVKRMELSGTGIELGSTFGVLSLVAIVLAMPSVMAFDGLATDVVLSISGVLPSSVAVPKY